MQNKTSKIFILCLWRDGHFSKLWLTVHGNIYSINTSHRTSPFISASRILKRVHLVNKIIQIINRVDKNQSVLKNTALLPQPDEQYVDWVLDVFRSAIDCIRKEVLTVL